MSQSDIVPLMRGIAPVLRDMVSRAAQPIIQRLLALEARELPKGEDGRDGKDGETGSPGRDGADGEQGPPGKEGRGFLVRGTYEPDIEYGAGDTVALNGGSFVALTDDPGPCPGAGWQMWARQGKPGQKGERGERGDVGERGPPGATIRLVGGRVDTDRMELVLVQEDGEALTIDLCPMAETIRAAL